MAQQRIRVGIVGLTPQRSWAAVAHLPALRHLSDDFEVVGVANSSAASAEAAAKACGIPRAFPDVKELAGSSDVDVVAVTVKVPHHYALVKAALEAGKHVYCEWPLGNGLAEAEELAELARAKGVLAVVGTQARVAPELEYVGRLVAQGFVGEVLSTTLLGSGFAWGSAIMDSAEYLLDPANGATMLSIPIGHTLAALQDVLGDVVEVCASLATRCKTVTLTGSGRQIPMSSPDQVLVNGLLRSGAPMSIHYVGGSPRGMGLLWRISGSEGDLEITGDMGQTQMTQLTVRGARGAETTLQPLPAPPSPSDWPEGAMVRNVARLYARLAADYREGTRTAPTFEDAVRLHRVLNAIEEASASGRRVPTSL